jgi:hypothetical protein
VDDPTVVAGLVATDLRLLLEDREPLPRPTPQQLHRRRQSDDPAADDGQVELARVDALVQRASREAMS